MSFIIMYDTNFFLIENAQNFKSTQSIVQRQHKSQIIINT